MCGVPSEALQMSCLAGVRLTLVSLATKKVATKKIIS